MKSLPPQEVAEFQGLYGAYSISETLLQKLWLRGAFDLSRARTLEGRPVRIIHPGTWNRLSGPDFRGAKLRLGDETVTGDVEVHFHAEAWEQHRHHTDPAYDDVVLHVVLFPPREPVPVVRTSSGREIPALVLVDLLWHDLEEYAADEAVAALSGGDPFPLLEDLLALAPEDRETGLLAAAERRWREKVHFAGRRVERLGWAQACHVTTLEILGYRSNRVAMLRVAEAFSFGAWQEQVPDLEDLVAAAAEWWTVRGVRPANQPRLRLAQYRSWMARRRDWPDRLRELTLPSWREADVNGDPGRLRRAAGLTRWGRRIAADLCADQLGGTRFDTWIINLVLPLLASQRGERGTREIWMAWAPGDAPDALLRAARQLAPTVPRSNGAVQALIGLELARRLPAAPGIEPSGADRT